MLVPVLILCFVVTWWATRRRRRLKWLGYEKTLLFKVIEQMLELSIGFAIAFSIYAVLIYLATFRWEALSVNSLVRLEHTFRVFKRVLDTWKLTWGWTLAILVGLFLLGLRFQTLATNTPFRWLRYIRRTLKLVNVVVFLLCSFTLLGFDPGEPAATLELHLQKIRSDYGVLRNRVSESLSGSAATKIAEKVTQQQPSYSRVFGSIYRFDAATVNLSEKYTRATRDYEIRDEDARILLAQSERRLATLRPEGRSETDTSTKDNAQGPDPVQSKEAYAPDEVSENSIQDAISKVEVLKSEAHPEAVKLLKSEGGKAIVLHMPSLATAKVTDFIDHPIVHAFPVLKPIFDSLATMASEAIKVRLEKKIKEITQKTARNPGEAREAIAKGSQEIADSVIANFSSLSPSHSQRDIQKLDSTSKAMESKAAHLFALSEQAESHLGDKLIEQLASPKESARDRAVEKLASRGDRLSNEQVRRIIEIMNRGTEKWTVSSEREGHCTWYEDVSIKYYAGRAIQNMRSPFLPGSAGTQAERAIENSRSRYKVTDPGWI